MNNQEARVDLHTHTCYSDGVLTPVELVEEAMWQGLTAIGITDHDSLAGIEEAQLAGKECGVEIIPGVEISCEHQGNEAHLLGYYLDKSDQIDINLQKLRENRVSRMHLMIENAQKQGLTLSYEETAKIAGNNSVGRPHLARVLIAKGYAKTMSEAFGKYIGDHGSIYVAKTRLGIARAIALIKDAGGISVLAHPGASNIEGSLDEIIAEGINGIEVYYCAHSKDQENFYKATAEKHNLLITGGSDYHGDKNHKRRLGQPSIAYKYVEKLRQFKARD